MAMVHSYALFVVLTSLLSVFKVNLAQPALLYDGESDIVFKPHKNWTIKYPFGVLCESPQWIKTITVNVRTQTPDQADLVMAFGTNYEYLAFAIPYDSKGVHIFGYFNNGTDLKAGALITPLPGSPLIQARTTLEEQFYEAGTFTDGSRTVDYTWRNTLPHNYRLKRWYPIVRNKFTPITENVQPLVLTIHCDRDSQQTQLTMSKNGISRTVTYSSTWPAREEAFFYMGLDYLHEEIYNLKWIRHVDECFAASLPTSPTTPAPPTSMNPTVAPSDRPTLRPTLIPTAAPTPSPSRVPSARPSSITFQPTTDPSLAPSDSESLSSDNPTSAPSTHPTHRPTESVGSTTETEAEQTVNVVNVESDDNGDDADTDSSSDNAPSFLEPGNSSVIDGIDNWMIVAVIAGVVIVLGIAICVAVRHKKKRFGDIIEDDLDDW